MFYSPFPTGPFVGIKTFINKEMKTRQVKDITKSQYLWWYAQDFKTKSDSKAHTHSLYLLCISPWAAPTAVNDLDRTIGDADHITGGPLTKRTNIL